MADNVIPFTPAEEDQGIRCPADVYRYAQRAGFVDVVLVGRLNEDGKGLRVMSNLTREGDIVLMLEQARTLVVDDSLERAE